MSEPVRTLTEEEVDQLQLQYYNTDVHRAAFTLPQFVKKVVHDCYNNNNNNDYASMISTKLQLRCREWVEII